MVSDNPRCGVFNGQDSQGNLAVSVAALDDAFDLRSRALTSTMLAMIALTSGVGLVTSVLDERRLNSINRALTALDSALAR